MKKLLLFPSWLVICFVLPFLPKKHPWYGRMFFLDDWKEHATPTTYAFSAVLWVAFLDVWLLAWVLCR